MKRKLCVAFLWHMHQPYYKDPLTGEISMPWVRLHGIKDYLDMVQMLEEFPFIHQNFNLVPSLIEQIKDYENPQNIKEKFLDLSLKKADELTDQDKAFILTNFFASNWETMVHKYPRYVDLLAKRGRYISPSQVCQAVKRFSTQDFLDLQVLFNLSWTDPSFQENIPEIKDLAKKTRFSEEDKKVILDVQLDILKKIIPKYKKMQESGQIEVSITPFYHPILPLLCDTDIATQALPHIRLPKRFKYPEDARWQISEAVKYYKKIFGNPPSGMWPSEGSVSEEAAAIMIENGLKWFATDEGVLYRSIGAGRAGEVLYKPYLLKRANGEIACVFRDHNLSDLIGFTYSRRKPMDAVGDLLKHLHNIYDHLENKDGNYLVSIILDGENAWEYYPNDGRDFLLGLYRALSMDPVLRSVTISEFLNEFPPKDQIYDLFPGSWINTNFAIWIGHEEKNIAWNYLGKARDALTQYEQSHPEDKDKIKEAWREIHIAEGSDWNWWYGDDHFSSYDDEFDRLYRLHLSNVYKLIGQDIPDHLKFPIRVGRVRPVHEPVNLFTPVIDGKDTNYYEWLSAGYLDITKTGGTMHQFAGMLRHFYYGFDKQKLYMRVDLELPQEKEERSGLSLDVVINQDYKIMVPISDTVLHPQAKLFKKDKHGSWKILKDIKDVAMDKIVEVGLDYKEIGAKPGDELQLQLLIQREDCVIEIEPSRGSLDIKVLPPDYEAETWSV